MEVISKIILGIIQGITEMLPVSSSAHLILTSKVLNFDLDLPFLTFLHLASAFAIVLGFWPEIKHIFFSKERKHLIKILLIGITPASITGLLMHNQVESLYSNITLIIINLILIGIAMIFVDVFIRQKHNIDKMEKIGVKNSLIIGLAQIIAFLPGVSRSGITILSGLLTGIDRKTAIAFSFLIGLPLIIFGFFFELTKNSGNTDLIFKAENLLGGLAAFIFGYFAILIFKKLANTSFLTIFGIYRILLGIVLVLALFI